MIVKSAVKNFLTSLFLGLICSNGIAQQAPLPEPLTIEAALQTAANPEHYRIALIEQKINEIDALVGVENSDLGISVDIRGRLRRVGVSNTGDANEDDDSSVSLLVSKPLYDFGRSDSRLEALQIEREVLIAEKLQSIEQRRLLILEKYFDVLSADNDFISENEDLAIAFIRFDRARENQLLGLSADIDVLKLQSQYETVRQARYLAESNQQLTRRILAEAMGYPRHLPSSLEIPIVDIDKPLSADVDFLIQRTLQFSLNAKVLAGQSKLAEYAIQQANTVGSPRLDLELEVSSYERETSTRDDWRASVYFDVPLYSGAKSSSLALAKVRYQKSLAQISRFRSGLRLEVLQLWQSIQQNRLIAKGNEIEQSYRDLYLDRSRAEYDLEFKTDLGDSMVQFSRARTARLKAVYAFELDYQRLKTLVGAEFLSATPNGDTQ